jgi:transposase
MQVVHERCCGLDVHKRTVVACVLTSGGREVRTFGTVTRELLRLADWLHEERVSCVAMESTGVYWKPVYNLLEGQGIELVVVNAQHMKALPGRKTDVKDSEWIADLLRHGLLRASFIPDRGQRELRELVRYRRRLIDQRADVVRRLQKVLEGANIKLGDVATDVMGVSSRAMLRALAEGQEDPAELTKLAKTSLRRKKAELQLAMEGSVGGHQRFMLRRQLNEVEFLEAEIKAMNAEIEERMRPFEAAIAHLDGITGIGRRSACRGSRTVDKSDHEM